MKTPGSLLFLFLLLPAVARAQAIRSPWDGHPVALTDAPDTCPTLPAVPADLTTEGFYKLGDPTHSIVDPVRMAAYTKSSSPAKNAALAIVQQADRYRTTGSRAAASCTVALLAQMAAGNSLAGHMSSGQAYYVQGWLAGAMAIAFLKIRESKVATPAETKSISAWLERLANSTRDWYDADLARKPDGNNHLYWAGLQLCATAAVTGNDKDLQWCVAAYRNGIRQIGPDGTLPLELSRGSRALHYHLYALAPLVLIAEFGQANRMQLYTEDHDALARLVQVSVAGLADPSFFARQSGATQEVPNAPSGDAVAWAPAYLARYPNPALERYVDHAPSLSSFYLGGLPAPAGTQRKP